MNTNTNNNNNKIVLNIVEFYKYDDDEIFFLV